MIGDIFKRLFGRADRAPRAIEGDVWDDIKRQIEVDIASGFEDPETIVDRALEIAEDEAGEASAAAMRPEAERILRAALAAQAAAEARWPAITDCDRLDAAFAALDEKGIVARQHWTCCGTCGAAEIGDEMDAAAAAGRPVRGYAFYHQQDTESAIEGDGVFLNYGATEDGEAAALAVARTIVTQLETSGLKPDWDGDWNRRIHVPLQWRRRLRAGAEG